MSTFATGTVTVTFDTDADKYDEKRPARVAIQEIPGGDTFYVDRAGRSPLTVTVGMVLANATEYGRLNTALAQQGSLAIDTLDTHSAVLMNVSRPAPEIDGRTRATAEFLITD
jgi:hypothetical protein